jgi:hypothetical protein
LLTGEKMQQEAKGQKQEKELRRIKKHGAKEGNLNGGKKANLEFQHGFGNSFESPVLP